MHELTLLLPDAGRLRAALGPSVLSTWIARGDRLPDVSAGRPAALRSCFEFIGTTVPVAALTRSIDEPRDAAGALWLRADPACVLADAVTLRLMRCGNVDLSQDESRSLAAALQPLFGDAGFPLEATTPSRWYLRCPPGAQLPEFSPPEAALGDDVGRHLPEGDAGRRWRHLLNEAQVILHNHPVNAARARNGSIPVNSVWIWGGGKLPDWARTTYSAVASDDDVARALARLANVTTDPLDPRVIDRTRPDDAHLLVDLAALRDPSVLDLDWFRRVEHALVARKLRALHLCFGSGEHYCYRRMHRWRFWRRVAAADPA